MTIGSINQIIEGLLAPVPVLKTTFTGQAAGGFHSSIFLAGSPGAASAPTGLNGTALTSLTGQITFPAAVAGTYSYLAGLDVSQGAGIGAVFLCDRVWHNGTIVSTTTTNQAITTPAFPARDRSAATAGDGYLVGLEVSTATTNGSPITNTTLSYTDSAGNTGNTATIASFPANAVAGTFVPFGLAAGDKGLGAIAGLTLGTSYGTGVIHLVVYRIIAQVGTPIAGVSSPMSPGRPRRMWDSSVPFLLYQLTGTTCGPVVADVQYTQG